MAKSKKSNKLDSIKDEVNQLHPLLKKLFPKLPRITNVEYCHGSTEMGADFVLSHTHDTFKATEHIGVIAKVGRVLQDFRAIERQIDECSLPRLIQGGKKKIHITEIWVIATKHITKGAQEKIHAKYRDRKITFIPGAILEKLIDDYTPLAWSGLPPELWDYLQDLRSSTRSEDRSLSLVPSDESFYIQQDLYHLPDIEYRYNITHRHGPRRIGIDDLTKSHRRILIEGGIGSGKSKLLRQVIIKSTDPDVFSKTKIIPLIATYGELMQKHSGDLKKLINHRVPIDVQKPCEECEYLVLIDAFDEHPIEVNDQADCLNDLFRQASAESRIRVVVTSRLLKGVDQSGALPQNVARCDLRELSMKRVIRFIIKLCSKIKVADRIIEDLKRSALFRDLPQHPMTVILLARLLNENRQELPSNMTDLYAKYLELILGRWDVQKGLQSQKEYQALDNILMRLSRLMIDDQRLFVPVAEAKTVFQQYLGKRNLDIDADQLFDQMLSRCDIIYRNNVTDTLGFKHRSFAEFFYAKSFTRDRSLVVDKRVFEGYWRNVFFFYLGLCKDCPDELLAILNMTTRSELEEWIKIIFVSDYLLAAYTTPYHVVEKGVRHIVETAADLYRRIVKEGSQTSFKNLSQMHLLFLLQLFIRQGYSYLFFMKAIEDAALRIDDAPATQIEEESKAYSLFFLNVAYIDIPKSNEDETFDFMLSRVKKALPIDLQLALGHEGKNVTERTKLMRKQDRRLRRILPRGKARKLLMEDLYDRPVNVVVKKSLKAKERKEKREEKRRKRQ